MGIEAMAKENKVFRLKRAVYRPHRDRGICDSGRETSACLTRLSLTRCGNLANRIVAPSWGPQDRWACIGHDENHITGRRCFPDA